MKQALRGRQLVPVLACLSSGLVLLAVWRGWLRLEVPGQHRFLRCDFAWGPLLLLPFGALLLLAAALVVLGGLNLAGVARAEWSRMLLFAMPLCLIGAGTAMRRLGLTRPLPALALVLSQGLFALVGHQLFDVWGHWVLPFR